METSNFKKLFKTLQNSLLILFKILDLITVIICCSSYRFAPTASTLELSFLYFEPSSNFARSAFHEKVFKA